MTSVSSILSISFVTTTTTTTATMKAAVMLALIAVVTAEKLYKPPSEDKPHIAIIKDERVQPDAEGYYVFDVETEDGIQRHESGGEGGRQQGSYSYTASDGTPVFVKFVADDQGYHPESDLLPVAPEFPHPIPDFVLDQIAFAAKEDAAKARSEERPSQSYSAP
ncbi:cuticle protein AM/CP1114-like [Portunus trituberculatus]|uniref:cuticle protein AM/CP1114-like n=1 Tax=Portunus trituberculatus TaxID=210409 RepID=UPI001E1D1FFF|nr:cuticle protein AM/CP1114-like [Portunus trituberculatus]